MLQLANGLGFHLTNTFAGDLEDPADFLERVRVAVTDSIPKLEDLSLSIGQCLEDVIDSASQHLTGGRLGWCFLTFIFDEVTELGVLGFPDGPIETDRMS